MTGKGAKMTTRRRYCGAWENCGRPNGVFGMGFAQDLNHEAHEGHEEEISNLFVLRKRRQKKVAKRIEIEEDLTMKLMKVMKEDEEKQT